MPRIKKTSSQPKRQPKKVVKIPEKIYPDFIENFRKELSAKTPFILKIDQFNDKDFYDVGVLQKQGKRHRCIWMVNSIVNAEQLEMFWKSNSYVNWSGQK